MSWIKLWFGLQYHKFKRNVRTKWRICFTLSFPLILIWNKNDRFLELNKINWWQHIKNDRIMVNTKLFSFRLRHIKQLVSCTHLHTCLQVFRSVQIAQIAWGKVCFIYVKYFTIYFPLYGINTHYIFNFDEMAFVE